jgi:hypothetical protein
MKTFICEVCLKVIDVNISNKKYNHKLCSICGKIVDLTDREMERFEKNQIYDQENRVKEITLHMSKVEANMLLDILADASKYHHELYEKYVDFNEIENRFSFTEEIDYHSNAGDLCAELNTRIYLLMNKEDSE